MKFHINVDLLEGKNALVDGRISIANCAEIAFEMADVDRVEPNLRKRQNAKPHVNSPSPINLNLQS